MVEIAIALGVIGFALVAIIGILPAGLEVQRDNRSETIINQDAQFWMEAIRSGTVEGEGLLERVEQIELRGLTPQFPIYTLGDGTGPTYRSVSNVIGLLTWAAGGFDRVAEARVSAISGAASEKEMDQSIRTNGVGFSYLLRVSIEPVNAGTPGLRTNSALPFIAVEKTDDRAVAIPMEVIEYFGYPDSTSLYEIRLTFFYPYVNANRLPPRAQVYRSTIARSLWNVPPASDQFFFRP